MNELKKDFTACVRWSLSFLAYFHGWTYRHTHTHGHKDTHSDIQS